MKIGVIGLGAVGETVYAALKFYHGDVVGYDKFKPSDPFEEVTEAEVVFVALPTQEKDGRLDYSIIKDTLEKLEKMDYSGVLVIKSTMSIAFVKTLEKSKLNIVIMPEFLHERARLQDFVRPKVIVIAGKEKDVKFVMEKVFYWLEDKIPVYITDYSTAVMAKLVMNAFAATKISFANEVRKICSCYGINPKSVMNILVSEGRAAAEYTDPTKGPFAGKCLPKDLEELINCSDKCILLKAVKEVNEAVKKEWKKES
jgi:nucleotide sugar dehydrogenase